jgi:hypothetical protein
VCPAGAAHTHKETEVRAPRTALVFSGLVIWAHALGFLSGCTPASGPGSGPARAAADPSAQDAVLQPRATSSVLTLVREDGLPGESYARLVRDGAWSWFSDPRAISVAGEHRRTYVAYVSSRGDISVTQYDHATGQITSKMVKEELQVDDNACPAILARPDHRLMLFYSGHRGRWLIYVLSASPEDVSSWGRPRAVGEHTSNFAGYTYPGAALLAAEGDRRYVFWRGEDFLPAFSTSERGLEWSEPVTLLTGGHGEPYFKMADDGNATIHFAFTDGHPSHEPLNSVHYMCYRDGSFFRADGSLVGTLADLPLDLAHADLVYDAGATGARAWLWDVAADSLGHPVIAYAAFPGEGDHRYRYARWDGATWLDSEMAPGGSWFPSVEVDRGHFDPYYSGGMALDHNDPSVVYLSRPVDDVFEIERWTTSDGGRSWSAKAVTSGSEHNNVRPVVPRDHLPDGPELVWMNGPYVDYEDFSTCLRVK